MTNICVCGNPDGTNKECERCRLIDEIEHLKRCQQRMRLTYLASPYTHAKPHVRYQRFMCVVEVAAELMRQGLLVYSPIAHTHTMAVEHDLPTDWQFWERHCRAFLAASDRLIVLKLDGWQESVGVAAEIAIAKKMDIPVSYLEYMR